MRLPRPAIALIATLVAWPVLAQAIAPVSGPHGNAAGCRIAAGGQPDSDDVLLLTPESAQTYATYCGFISRFATGNDDVVLLSVCGHEGDEMETVGFIRIRPVEDGFQVFDGDGADWGRAMPCP